MARELQRGEVMETFNANSNTDIDRMAAALDKGQIISGGGFTAKVVSSPAGGRLFRLTGPNVDIDVHYNTASDAAWGLVRLSDVAVFTASEVR